VREIYRFFDELGISTRFLPFFETGLAWQENLNALSNAEIAGGLIEIFEEWLGSSRATPSLPVEHYLAIAVYSMAGRPWPRFDRRTDESVFVVNTDGGVWGEPEAYDPEFGFGNIFRHDLRELLRSPGREKAISGSEDRQEAYCKECPYHESCSGYFMASNLAYEITPATPHRCVARDVASYMVDRLERSELRDEIMATYAERVDNGALSVGL
jgi:radical SAM protein with 4Fe4S-binding SPASM domain